MYDALWIQFGPHWLQAVDNLGFDIVHLSSECRTKQGDG